jgi:hypothetical protein
MLGPSQNIKVKFKCDKMFLFFESISMQYSCVMVNVKNQEL